MIQAYCLFDRARRVQVRFTAGPDQTYRVVYLGGRSSGHYRGRYTPALRRARSGGTLGRATPLGRSFGRSYTGRTYGVSCGRSEELLSA